MMHLVCGCRNLREAVETSYPEKFPYYLEEGKRAEN